MKNEGLKIQLKSNAMPKWNIKSSVRRRMGLIVILILHSSFFSLYSHAQTFTDRLRQHEEGKGNVTITQSAEIEDLVNNAVLVPQKQPAQQQQQPAQQSQATPQQPHQYVQPQGQTTTSASSNAQSAQKNQNTPSTQSSQVTSGKQQTQDTEDTTVDTSKKVIRGGHKVQGYRVQVFSGGNSRTDRQKAERIGATMKSHFPDQPVYVHFYSPSWKCRIGNYRTAEEARLVLSQVKQLGYSSACIVKGTIIVP